MTIIQAAKVLGIKVRTVRRWIQLGWLDAEKRSDNKWYITEIKEEDKKRANEHRKFAPRVAGSTTVGMLAGGGKNPQKSV